MKKAYCEVYKTINGLNTIMKKLLIGVFVFVALAVVAPQEASAATYYSGTVDARIETLFREVARLQAELARLRGGNVGGQCYTYGNAEYCYRNGYRQRPVASSDIRSIDVEYKNSAAYATVEFRSGREREYTIGGVDSDNEVIDALADALNVPRGHVVAVISFSGSHDDDDDIDYIRVTIDRDDDEAEARVRYDDGDTDTFDYDTEDKDDIIEELSDDLDIDEDDVEDLIDWNYNDSNSNSYDIEDVDSIDADINEDTNKTDVWVEFDNGVTKHFVYNTDDEDDVIEELSDDLDIDEDDIEDIIDFDYVD
jgi:energy-converting hydrogenase A subunit M